jgi:hypothetical protein
MQSKKARGIPCFGDFSWVPCSVGRAGFSNSKKGFQGNKTVIIFGLL